MPLFNPRVMTGALAQPRPIPEHHLGLLQQWAAKVRDGSIDSLNEIQLEGRFASVIMEQVLGYTPLVAGKTATMKAKQPMGGGTVDLALGEFPEAGAARVIAPFELKGGKTRDLDAPMPGRKISPVQQAWNYANALPGVKWVLVSNYREIRLYAFGEGNQDYERIDLSRIDNAEEYARLMLLLAAGNFLGGNTASLLRQSKDAEKEISTSLYRDYKTLREKLIDAVNAETAGANPVAAVSAAQKILDRVLFIAFAEDRGLLPSKSLEKAFTSQNPYAPAPVWENFKGLFRAIDQGSAALGITKYNGGLFVHDPAIDGLNLSDAICEDFRIIGGYNFDTEVSVTILGHIFEQSVTDVERLLNRARGGEPDDDKQIAKSGRRKRDGIVYTPDYIAQFIVEKTLGTHVEELFRSIMAKHAKGDPADYESLKFGPKSGTGEALKNELQAWYEYRLALKSLRVVDPACGSGVFLVTAFDYLRAENDRLNKKISALRGMKDDIVDIEDLDREILSQNLYGVDVNAESVEITKLSLWLKTARRGKELDSLDHNIRVGDSLIEDSNFAYLKHGFVWNQAFPEVFAAGGFDVVLGNPPYVSGAHFGELKSFMQSRFEVFHGNADLYCFFYERGLRLLKKNGRLGFISSSTFFKSDFGMPLRKYLRERVELDLVVDFRDTQIFEGVTTYTTILVLKNNLPSPSHKLEFLSVSEIPAGNFNAAFRNEFRSYCQSFLEDEYWQIESHELRKIRKKIIGDWPLLSSVYGSPLYGIKTGANDIFVISGEVRSKLVDEDSSAGRIVFPFLEGEDIHRWRSELKDTWIIFTRRGIEIDQYPSVKNYLSEFRDRLEPRPKQWKQAIAGQKWTGRKSGPYKWYELQDACDYWERLLEPKIVYNRFLSKPEFCLDKSGTLTNDAPYSITNGDEYLLSLLNSNSLWFIVTGRSTRLRGGFYQLLAQFVESLPIPHANPDDCISLNNLSAACQSNAENNLKIQLAFRRRIPDLCPAGRKPKLSTRLHDWWALPDFAAFRAEVKKCFKADIPVKERGDWEDLFHAGKAEIVRLSAGIKRNEDEINAIVYRLFGLTPDEIALLEESIGARPAPAIGNDG